MMIKTVVGVNTQSKLTTGQTLFWTHDLYQLNLITVIPKKDLEIGAKITFTLQVTK